MVPLLHTLVLPVFDPKDTLGATGLLDRCFDSVGTLEGDVELIVVNVTGAPTPTTQEYLVDRCHQLDGKLIETPAQMGTSAVVNFALKLSRTSSDSLVFMSQDAEAVQSEVLGELGHALVEMPALSAVHPCSVFEDNEEYNIFPSFSSHASTGYSWRPAPDADDTLELDTTGIDRCLATVRGRERLVQAFWSFPLTFAMMRRDALVELGGFDERFWYCHENNDYSLRSLLSGRMVGRAESAFVNHRRFLFRAAGVAGDELRIVLAGHDQGMDRWIEKWGAPYGEQLRTRLGV